MQPGGRGSVHGASRPQDTSRGPCAHSVTTWTATCGSATSTRGWKDVRTCRSLWEDLLWTPTLPCWPAPRSTGPHAMSLITLQEDICNWTSSLFSEEARSGHQNKGRSLQNTGGGIHPCCESGSGPTCAEDQKHGGCGSMRMELGGDWIPTWVVQQPAPWAPTTPSPVWTDLWSPKGKNALRVSFLHPPDPGRPFS